MTDSANSSEKSGWIVFLFAAALVLFIVPPHLHPNNYPADDAYFYLEVASNIYGGLGSTFNGIVPTNGYHPLWMPFCVLSFAAAAGSKLGALHVAIVFQQLMAIGVLVVLAGTSRRLEIKCWPLMLPVLFLFFLTRLYLSEAYVNALTLSLLIYVVSGIICGQRKAFHYVLAGIFAGLAALARLDNVFVIASIFTFTVLESIDWNWRRVVSGVSIRTSLLLAIPFVLVLAPYFGWNMARFGHLVPISGSIKSASASFGFNPDGLSSLGKLCTLVALVNIPLCATAFFPRARRMVLLMLSVGVALLSAYIVFLTNHHTDWPWYYVSGMITLALSAGAYADAILGRSPALAKMISVKTVAVVALLASILLNSYAWVRYRNPGIIYGEGTLQERLANLQDTRWQEDVGNWLGESLPDNSRIFIYDWPGIITYISDQDIIAPDGLINDFQYNDDIIEKGIAKYLADNGVVYWLGPAEAGATRTQAWYSVTFETDGQTMEIMAPLYQKSAGTFSVRDKDRIVQFRNVLDNPGLPDIALWRMTNGDDR